MALGCAPEPIQRGDPVDLFASANLHIGTGGQGFGYGGLAPAAMTPGGLVKVAPDTTGESSRAGFHHTAGYWADDPYTLMFSHYRLPGIGVADGGGLGFMLTADEQPEDTRAPVGQWSELEPGSFTVSVPDVGTLSTSVTDHLAVHQIRWDAGAGWLTVDMRHCSPDTTVEDPSVVPTDGGLQVYGLLRGSLTGRGDSGVPLYGEITFDPLPTGVQLWRDGAPVDADGTHATLSFDGPTTMQVGLSVVDHAGAALALDQVPDPEPEWRALLDVVQVWGGTDTEQVLFASAMHNVLQMPTTYTDSDGRFRGLDGEIDTADGWTYRSDFSMWDTYRTLHPLVIWLWPDRARDYNRSLVDMSEKAGFFPRWPAGLTESGSMVGASADVVLGESLAKGVTDWGEDAAWDLAYLHAMDGSATRTRHSLDAYMELGWIPAEDEGGSVSKTQEMAINDAGLSLWATYLGLDAEADALIERSGNFANVHNPETQFAQGRFRDGTWDELGDEPWPDNYVEGNPWQYTWLAPHDPEGLADAFGDRSAALDKLEQFFVLAAEQEDTAFQDPYYWHGNEPDLHAAWLFSPMGRPDLTQQWVGWVRDTKYLNQPAGIDGNDDGGTLSAWYVFAALGLYPLNGTDRYILTTPVFDAWQVHDLRVQCTGDGDYLAGAILDGQVLDAPELSHDQLVNGRELLLIRSPEPSEWGVW